MLHDALTNRNSAPGDDSVIGMLSDPGETTLPQVEYRMRVNLWLLLGSGVVLVALGVAVHRLHEWQEARQAIVLLERADQAEQNGNGAQVVALLRQYLTRKPTDLTSKKRVALLVDEMAVTAREKRAALQQLEAILREASDAKEIRKRLILGWISFQRVADARTHLERLQADDFDAGEYEFLQGRCAEIASEGTSAPRWYTESIEKSPDRLDAYAHLARIYQLQEDRARMKAILDRMLIANPSSVTARLIAADFAAAAGENLKSATQIAEAIRLDPHNIEALVTVANLKGKPADTTDPESASVADLLKTLDWEEITDDLRQAVGDDPHDLRLYRVLAQLALAEGDVDAAAQWLQSGLENNPRAFELGSEVIQLVAEAKGSAAARGQLEILIAAGAPFELTSALSGYLTAVDLFSQERWEEARAQLEPLRRRLDENDSFRWVVEMRMAECLRQLKNPQGEQELLETALRGRSPDARYHQARLRLAILKTSAGEVDGALRLLSRDSASAAEATARADLLLRRTLRRPENERDWSEVETAIDRLAELAPNSPSIPFLRARVFQQRGDADQARRVLREARETSPEEVGYWTVAIELEVMSGEREEAARLLAAAEQQFGDIVPLRVARLNDLTLRPGGPNLDAIEQLASGLDRFAPDDQFRLLEQMTQALTNARMPQAALRLTSRMCELRPDDLDAWLPHLEAATALNQMDQAEQALAAIQRIDGSDSPSWMLGRAIVDMMRLDDSMPPAELQKLEELLTRVTEQRPKSIRPHRYLGQIQMFERKFEDAIQSFAKAFELGDRHPIVLSGYL